MIQSIEIHLFDFIKSVILFGTLVVGIFQLLRLKKQIQEDYAWKRKEQALNYSQIYQNTYANTKRKIEKTFSEGKSLIGRTMLSIPSEEIHKAINNKEITQSDITTFLSYYENIGLAVKHNIADFEVIVDLLGTTYYKTFNLFYLYINESRKRNKLLWKNFEYLANRIETETNLINNCVLILSDDAVPINNNLNKPFLQENYNESYKHFIHIGLKYGIRVVIASEKDFENNYLDTGWTISQGKWNKIHNIKPLLIFDKFQSISEKTKNLKKSIIQNNIHIINNIDFSNLLQNKLETYKKLKQYMLPSMSLDKITKKQEIISKVKKFIETYHNPDLSKNKFVIKPNEGYGGKNIVLINTIDEINKVKNINNMIIQPFLDTSKGIPELLIHKKHDLRILLLNGKIIQSYIRIPLDSDFISNFGTIKYIDIKKLPSKIKEICYKIDSKFHMYKPRFYSIDFGIGISGHPWVYELNAKPGIVWKNNNKEDERNTKKLHENIMRVIAKDFLNQIHNKSLDDE